MPKQTAINDAQIRAASVIIEELAHNISNRAEMLREQFDTLYPNIQFADPVRDATFNRYMLTLAHVKMLCDQAPSLAHQAREMQRFGKEQIVEEVVRINQVEDLRRARPCLPRAQSKGVEPLAVAQ